MKHEFMTIINIITYFLYMDIYKISAKDHCLLKVYAEN